MCENLLEKEEKMTWREIQIDRARYCWLGKGQGQTSDLINVKKTAVSLPSPPLAADVTGRKHPK
jgi:hypothetical protein